MQRGRAKVLSEAESEESTTELLRVLGEVVAPLALAMPLPSEVVLHDLRRLPNSIVSITGNATGRRIGDPATDVLLQHLQSGEDVVVGYPTDLPDGREGRSTTVILRLEGGDPFAALCVNVDVTGWRAAGQSVERFLRVGGAEQVASRIPDTSLAPTTSPRPSEGEMFVRNVEELATELIRREIARIGIPVEEMKKRHKLRVVAGLESRGMFMLRDAVDTVALALNVTRFTIYNYMSELASE
ncbi:PAS domain-containing protein [Rhodococcus erythropolis]|nr:PAS domain-containing protein [Rhodococcus erythropolis]